MNAFCLTKIPVSQSLLSIWRLKPVNINSLKENPPSRGVLITAHAYSDRGAPRMFPVSLGKVIGISSHLIILLSFHISSFQSLFPSESWTFGALTLH